MSNLTSPPDIRDAFFEQVYALAERDPSLVFLSADMGAKTIDRFKKERPDQFYNVGVAEQNLVSVAAGLALSGKRVVCYGIVSFLIHRSRAQVRHDLCIMNLPVTLVGSGPGLCYDFDGASHHAIEDVATMRSLPRMAIYSPCDHLSAAGAARQAFGGAQPAYVRLDKGALAPLHSAHDDFAAGASLLRSGDDVLIVSTGIMTQQAVQVADALRGQGIHASILDVYRIKPFPEEMLLGLVDQHAAVVTLEEHSRIGGLGSACAELWVDHGVTTPLKRFALADEYQAVRGSRAWLHRRYGIDVPTVVAGIQTWLPRVTLRPISRFEPVMSEAC